MSSSFSKLSVLDPSSSPSLCTTLSSSDDVTLSVFEHIAKDIGARGANIDENFFSVGMDMDERFLGRREVQ